jgi:hypothetical protein
MVGANDTVIIEVAGPQNENLWFLPLDRRIRGRFNPAAIPEPSGALMRRFPQGIPGQHIGLDAKAGVGWIDEPWRPAGRVPWYRVSPASRRFPRGSPGPPNSIRPTSGGCIPASRRLPRRLLSVRFSSAARPGGRNDGRVPGVG